MLLLLTGMLNGIPYLFKGGKVSIIVNQFYQDLVGDETINFLCMSEGNTIKVNGLYNKNTSSKLQQLNEQDFDIYFVVNIGGYKNQDIVGINAVFIDLDCGRDSQGIYYKLDTVSNYKKKMLAEIARYQYNPSYIIETRNGLHVYWLVDSSATVEQFIECESRLIRYFNADGHVRKPANLMRVPGYNWCKDRNNKFMVEIIKHSNVRYDIQAIIDSVPVESEGRDLGTNNKKKNNTLLSIVGTKNPEGVDDNTTYIINQEISKLQNIIKPKEFLVNDHEEVYDYLKRQDLSLFLGVTGKNFRCIFHNDNRPSAGIIQNIETGHYIYFCHSESCGFKGTIIQCAEKLLGSSRVNALQFLRKVYMVEYAETEWQKRQKELLEENQRFIYGDEFKEFYPQLYKRVKHYLLLLYILNGISREHVLTENFTDSNDNALFFASTRYIAKLSNQDEKRIATRIGILTYLGLIKKLSEDEIPEFLLLRAKEEAKKNYRFHYTSYYSIPSYCYNTLSFGEQRAIEFKSRSYTVKGWCREMILRCEGEHEANRVFPQMNGKVIDSYSHYLTHKMELILMNLIEEKGWCTEQEVLDGLEIKLTKAKKEKQFKRVIGETLDKYDLKRIRSNNRIKQHFRITTSGYPFLITSKKRLDEYYA